MTLTEKRIESIDREIERLQADKARFQEQQKKQAEKIANHSAEEIKDFASKVVS